MICLGSRWSVLVGHDRTNGAKPSADAQWISKWCFWVRLHLTVHRWTLLFPRIPKRWWFWYSAPSWNISYGLKPLLDLTIAVKAGLSLGMSLRSQSRRNRRGKISRLISVPVIYQKAEQVYMGTRASSWCHRPITDMAESWKSCKCFIGDFDLSKTTFPSSRHSYTYRTVQDLVWSISIGSLSHEAGITDCTMPHYLMTPIPFFYSRAIGFNGGFATRKSPNKAFCLPLNLKTNLVWNLSTLFFAQKSTVSIDLYRRVCVSAVNRFVFPGVCTTWTICSSASHTTKRVLISRF